MCLETGSFACELINNSEERESEEEKKKEEKYDTDLYAIMIYQPRVHPCDIS